MERKKENFDRREMSSRKQTFPVLRWVALIWMVVWLPAYIKVWGFGNLLHLCDAAMILTFAGLWWGNAALISSQAVSALAAGVLWTANVGMGLLTGKFFASGSEYMFDERFPLWVRLLSLFHVVLPCALLWGLWRLRYDPSGLRLQAGLAAALIVAGRFLSPQLNMNWAYRDPLFNRAWGPAPIHLTVIWAGAAILLYWPTHLVLSRLFASRADPRLTPSTLNNT